MATILLTIGAVAVFLVVCGGALAYANHTDRKEQELFDMVWSTHQKQAELNQKLRKMGIKQY